MAHHDDNCNVRSTKVGNKRSCCLAFCGKSLCDLTPYKSRICLPQTVPCHCCASRVLDCIQQGKNI